MGFVFICTDFSDLPNARRLLRTSFNGVTRRHCTDLRVRGTAPGKHPEPAAASVPNPPIYDNNAEGRQAAATSAHELGVGLMAFASSG